MVDDSKNLEVQENSRTEGGENQHANDNLSIASDRNDSSDSDSEGEPQRKKRKRVRSLEEDLQTNTFLASLMENGYNVEVDVFNARDDPAEAQRRINDLGVSVARSLKAVKTIDDQNWGKASAAVCKTARVLSKNSMYRNTGLQFLIRDEIISKMEGTKADEFLDNHREDDLDNILKALESNVSEDDHPVTILLKFLELREKGITLKSEEMKKIEKFAKYAMGIKSLDKMKIWAAQALMDKSWKLNEEWRDYDSFEEFVKKVQLRQIENKVSREQGSNHHIVNHISTQGAKYNSKKFSTGKPATKGRNMAKAQAFFAQKLGVKKLSEDILAKITSRWDQHCCIGCGKKGHLYWRCQKIDLRQ